MLEGGIPFPSSGGGVPSVSSDLGLNPHPTLDRVSEEENENEEDENEEVEIENENDNDDGSSEIAAGSGCLTRPEQNLK